MGPHFWGKIAAERVGNAVLAVPLQRAGLSVPSYGETSIVFALGEEL